MTSKKNIKGILIVYTYFHYIVGDFVPLNPLWFSQFLSEHPIKLFLQHSSMFQIPNIFLSQNQFQKVYELRCQTYHRNGPLLGTYMFSPLVTLFITVTKSSSDVI